MYAQVPTLIRMETRKLRAARDGSDNSQEVDQDLEPAAEMGRAHLHNSADDVFAPTRAHASQDSEERGESVGSLSHEVSRHSIDISTKPRVARILAAGLAASHKAYWHDFCEQALILTCSTRVWYEFLMWVGAVLAVMVQEPTFTFVPLFEICFWKGSVPVIDAVRFNAGKMLQTFLLGLLVMYVWMLMGIWWLSGEHQPETCNNMLQCFWSYFYMSMREAGIRDIMEDAQYAHTLGDFAVGEGNMLLRAIWDMIYQFLFLYVLIAIITGLPRASRCTLLQMLIPFCSVQQAFG